VNVSSENVILKLQEVSQKHELVEHLICD